MTLSRIGLIVAAIVIAVSVGVAAAMLAGRGGGGSGEALVGGDFTLTDHTGARVSDDDFRGRLMLVYFGYTYCPDVCPTELQVMSDAIDRLGAEASEVAPIFITVDPERDTVETLSEYVPFFHERMIGLTGTEHEIADAARAYRVYYARADTDDGPYLMDHTSFVYLMGRDGKYLTHFTSGTSAEDMAAAIRDAL